MAKSDGFRKITKIEKTKILPLRWIGNLCGEVASTSLVRAFDLDEDGDLVDFFYDDIFNNELKGKPGIKGNNFNEFQTIDREENNGENVKLLYNKITQIITDYKKTKL